MHDRAAMSQPTEAHQRRPPGFESSSTKGDEELPEALHRRDADTLVGGMRELDLRAERDHVEAGAPCFR